MPESAELLAIMLRRLERIEGKIDALAPAPSPRLTVAQAATEANTSPDTIRRALAARELRFHQSHTGAAIRIDGKDLQAWIARSAVEPVRRR